VGNAGCPPHPQPRVRNKTKHTSIVTTGHTGNRPAFPHAMILTVSFVLSPVIGLACHRRFRIWRVKTRLVLRTSANLTPASRRQDHTTSPSAESIVRQRAIRSLTGRIDPPCHPLTSPDAAASTASRPASVTIAIRPCVGRDGGSYGSDLGQAGNEIFLQMGLDRQIAPLRSSSDGGHGRPVGRFLRIGRLNDTCASRRGAPGNIHDRAW